MIKRINSLGSKYLLSGLALMSLSTRAEAIFEARARYESALGAAGEWNFNQAIAYLQAAIEEDSSFTVAYLRLADYYSFGKNAQAGIQFFEEAIQANSRNSNLYLGLSSLAKNEDDWDRAFAQANLALQQGSTSQVAVAILVESALQIDTASTLPWVLRQLTKNPAQNHLYDFGYAVWRFRIRNYRRARTTLAKLLETSPGPQTFSLLGEIEQRARNLMKSTASYHRALEMLESGEPFLQASLLRSIGINHVSNGHLDSARVFLAKSLALARSAGSLKTELSVRQDLAELYRSTASYQKWADICSGGIECARQLENPQALQAFSFQLGLAFAKMADHTNAVKHFETLFDPSNKAPDPELTGRALMETAKVHLKRGRTNLAFSYLNRSLEIARLHTLAELEYSTRLTLADLYNSQGDVDNAKKSYETVLRYAQRTRQYDIVERCFSSLTRLYLKPGADLKDAKYYISLAQALSRQTLSLKSAANNRSLQGEIALLENSVEKAETYFTDGIQLATDTGSYGVLVTANAGLIRTYLAAGFPKLATARLDSVLRNLHQYGALCLEDGVLSDFDYKEQLFIPAIEALSATGNLSEIYNTFEKYKALEHVRDLANLQYKLNSSAVDSLKQLNEEIDAQLQRKWSGLWNLWREDQRDNLNQVMTIKTEISKLLVDRRISQLKLRDNYPEYFSLVYPNTKRLQELRARLQESNGAFIHYLVGELRTHIVLARADSIFFKQVNVEKRRLSDLVDRVSPVFQVSQNADRLHPKAGRDVFNLRPAGELYREIFEPIRLWLPAEANLLISPDDVLSAVPFECLVTNSQVLSDDSDFTAAKFLVEDFAISYVPYGKSVDWPSASERGSRQPLVAFVSPTGRSTTLPQSANRSRDENSEDINGENDASNGPSSNELSNEIAAIEDALGRSNMTSYLGGDSGKQRFLTEAGKYRILHLRVPGLLDEISPLYSQLHFSGPTGTGEALAIYEIFNLESGGDLAVLSATQRKGTGSGGVGVLLHALNYSGVASLVVRLWDADDRKTSKLLGSFYSGLAEGMTKPEALRQAKLVYMNVRNRNPYYWAPFVLYGNTESIALRSTNVDFVVILTTVGVIVLAIVLTFQYSRIRKERKNAA